MARVDQAAKSALDNFCVGSLEKLSGALTKAAKDKAIGTSLTPIAIDGLVRRMIARLDGPATTAEVDRLGHRLEPLLKTLMRKGIQQGDRFNHEIDDQLKALSDLL